MNYFEHHIGDYAEATSHLTFVEDAAYHRLMRKYYAKEMPIPADLKQAQRLIGARTKEEREAVQAVLEEFFSLEQDGWHQKKCDEVIEKYLSGEPEREVKKANEDNRLKRHREERAKLFKIITDAGEHAPWNIGTKELRDLANRIQNVVPDTAADTKPETPPDTAPATPATATQYPLTNTHSPVPIGLNTNTASTDVLAPAFPDEKQPEPELPGLPKAQIPDCPHLKVLELWAEVLPALPQHNPEMWKGARADHLRARWRETSILKKWPDQDAGVAYFRKLFRYVGTSPFLTGQARSTDLSKRPFTIELEWLVNPSNWAKVHEGKYHSEA